ncbi:CHASE3 domain-containing protein [Cystobacter fuscus]
MFSRWTVGRQFFVGLLLISTLITCFIFLTRKSTQKLMNAELLVERSHQTIGQIERVFSIIKDAESGQRDYLITGNEGALEPFRRHRPPWPGSSSPCACCSPTAPSNCGGWTRSRIWPRSAWRACAPTSTCAATRDSTPPWRA